MGALLLRWRFRHVSVELVFDAKATSLELTIEGGTFWVFTVVLAEIFLWRMYKI